MRSRNVPTRADRTPRAKWPSAVATARRAAQIRALTPVTLAVLTALHGMPTHAGETLPVVITPIPSNASAAIYDAVGAH